MRWPRARLRVHGRLFLCAGLFLSAAVSVTGAPQADDRKPGAAQRARTDLYGDPLPPGAVARLGTLRDNIGDTSGAIVRSPDGKFVTATTSIWLIIPLRLWDAESGRVLLYLKELEPPATHPGVRRVAFSPDGKLLAAGDSVGTVRIGRTDTGRKIRELVGPTDTGRNIRELVGPEAVSYMAFVPDGKSLAVAYADGSIWLYRLSTGERIRSLAVAPFYNILYVNVFSPDGKVLSLRRLDGSLSVRDVLTGREIRRLFQRPVRPGKRLSLGGTPLDFSVPDGLFRAFSPDDKLLAFGGRNGTLRIWDVAAGREIRWFPQPPLRPRPFRLDIDDSVEFHLAFSPDGKLVAAEDTRDSTCLWSVATGQPYRRFPHLEIGHGIAFTADGKRLISGGRHFRYWDIARGQEIRRYPKQDEVQAVAFGPGGKTLATADGVTVRLWEASSGRELRQFREHQAPVAEVAIAPDGKMIASGDDDGTLILWDLNTGREVRRVAGPAPGREASQDLAQTSAVSIAFAPDGKTYVTSDDRGTRLWDVASGGEILRFAGAKNAVRSLCFAPDGGTLAGVYGHGILLWDVATGRKRRTLGHTESPRALAFAPGRKILATGDTLGCLHLWNVQTGQELKQFRDDRPPDEERSGITSLAFLPDGKTVASGSDDSFARLWDAETGQKRRRLEGHTNSVFLIAIAPDGKTLASASVDGTTLVWDSTMIGKD